MLPLSLSELPGEVIEFQLDIADIQQRLQQREEIIAG